MKKKLLFFCSRFGGGGAEMHLLRVISHCDFNKYEVHLALSRDGGNYEQRVPADIKIHYLNKGINSSIVALLKASRPLKKLIKDLKPDGVISFMDPQNLVLTHIKKSLKNCPPIIICCQNAPQKNLASEGLRGKLIKALIFKWYNRANKVIAICNGVGEELKTYFNVKVPVDVVYNAGYDETYKQKMSEPLPPAVVKRNNQLVAVGRLTKQKGFDILLNALAILKDDNIDFNIWMLGQGEEDEKLRAQCSRLKLDDKVQFMGFQSNPYPFFKNADVFVLSSRWEGFGNVITEAMVCGTPVVATKCDFGPDEIITHGTNGLLCEIDEKSIAAELKHILSDSDRRQALAKEAEKRAAFFSAESISKQYFEAISSTL